MQCLPFATCPGFLLGPLPVPPDDNTGPYIYGHGMAAADAPATPPPLTHVDPICVNICHTNHLPPDHEMADDPPDPITQRPTFLDTDDHFPEFSSDSPDPYIVRSLRGRGYFYIIFFQVYIYLLDTVGVILHCGFVRSVSFFVRRVSLFT